MARSISGGPMRRLRRRILYPPYYAAMVLVASIPQLCMLVWTMHGPAWAVQTGRWLWFLWSIAFSLFFALMTLIFAWARRTRKMELGAEMMPMSALGALGAAIALAAGSIRAAGAISSGMGVVIALASIIRKPSRMIAAQVAVRGLECCAALARSAPALGASWAASALSFVLKRGSLESLIRTRPTLAGFVRASMSGCAVGGG